MVMNYLELPRRKLYQSSVFMATTICMSDAHMHVYLSNVSHQLAPSPRIILHFTYLCPVYAFTKICLWTNNIGLLRGMPIGFHLGPLILWTGLRRQGHLNKEAIYTHLPYQMPHTIRIQKG